MTPTGTRALATLLLAAASGLLVVALASSLDWRMSQDTPILLYMAWLMDRAGALPHRDFFDMNLLGTYAIYRGVGGLLGYSDLAVRIAELGFLASLLGLAARFARPLGRYGAWAAVAVPGLAYLRVAGGQALQRDFLLLVPLMGAALLAASEARPTPPRRAFLVGLLVGAAMTIKPHAALYALPMLLTLASGHGSTSASARRIPVLGLWGALGLAVLPAGSLVILAWLGVLPDFLSIFREYLPLYGEIGGHHRLAHGTERLWRTLRGLADPGALWALILPAALGLTMAWWHTPRQRHRVGLLAGLCAIAWLHTAFPGQFWSYHWIPLGFFAALAAGLCFEPLAALRWRAWLPPLLLAGTLLWLLQPARGFEPILRDRSVPPKGGRPDRIARYLRAHLEPGDTVQPLDWASAGVVHGMLLAEAPAATRWIYDFHFHHHVSHPYIQRIREEFLDDLAAASPRFLVVGHTVRPYFRGPDTQADFPALERWRDEHYQPVLEKPGFTIWERIRR